MKREDRAPTGVGRVLAVSVASALAPVTLSSCGAAEVATDVPAATTAAPTSGTIDGPVLMDAPSNHTVMDALIRDALTYDTTTNCVRLARSGTPVVFRPGAAWRAEPPAVVVPGGQVLAVGVPFTVGGGSIPVAMVEATAGSDVAAAAQRCGGAGRSVTMLQGSFEISG